jgi:hypothetical protein
MDKLDEYLNDLRKLRRGRAGDIPAFSVKDGRTEAEALFLFQDPGNSGAADSGVVDRDNKDESAKVFKALNEEQELDREKTVSWNSIPWAVQGNDFGAELVQVREWELVPKLLDALPKVRVVVLCGKTVAWKLEPDVAAYGEGKDREMLILKGPHPSRRGMMSRPGGFTREQNIAWLRRVIEQARDHVAGA